MRAIVIAATLSCAFAGAVLAQEPAAGGPLAVCKADADKLCATAPDGRERMRCLRDNLAKVSPDCKAGIEKFAALRKSADEACKADRASLCKDGADNRGLRCLRENLAKVSKACADAIGALPQWAGAGESKAKQ